MRKTALINALLSTTLFLALSPFAQAGDCRVEGGAFIPGLDPNASTGEGQPVLGAWDQTETIDYPAAHLAGSIGGPSGSDRFYSGPANGSGAVLYGPYRDFVGISELGLSSKIDFSTDWRPDGYEYCSKHKTKWNGARVCVEKRIAYHETSFVVDITQNLNGVLGTPIYSKVFKNVNTFSRGTIYLPNIRCFGDVNSLEVRIHSLQGGSVDFTVHNLSLDARWRY